MGSFYSLEIGKKALLAQRFGLDVTSNNIANVNTPGYSRRSAVINETSPIKSNGQYVGTGSQVGLLRNFRQELLDKEIRSSTAQVQNYTIEQELYQKIDAVLGEPSDNGINELTTSFLTTFNQVSINPEDIATRQYLLEQGQTLAERLNYTSNEMTEIRNDIKLTLSQELTKANQLLVEISNLNNNIVTSSAQTNNAAHTYIDERAAKIEELSKMFSVNVAYNEDGSANLFINGSNIITNQNASELRLSESINSVTSERTLEIIKYNPVTESSTLILPQSGQVASYLKFYNVVFDDKESTNGFSITKSLDEFTNALAQQVNSKTMAGYGLNDKGTAPVGRSFFEPSAGFVSASLIKLSEDILGKPSDIPLSSKPNEPGNNEVALDIARILEDRSFLDGQNPTEYYANYIGKVSFATAEATNGLTNSKMINTQIETQRESLIGVNLDEEAVNLIKFQKAFEASSRVINTANEMMNTIVNLGL